MIFTIVLKIRHAGSMPNRKPLKLTGQTRHLNEPTTRGTSTGRPVGRFDLFDPATASSIVSSTGTIGHRINRSATDTRFSGNFSMREIPPLKKLLNLINDMLSDHRTPFPIKTMLILVTFSILTILHTR